MPSPHLPRYSNGCCLLREDLGHEGLFHRVKDLYEADDLCDICWSLKAILVLWGNPALTLPCKATGDGSPFVSDDLFLRAWFRLSSEQKLSEDYLFKLCVCVCRRNQRTILGVHRHTPSYWFCFLLFLFSFKKTNKKNKQIKPKSLTDPELTDWVRVVGKWV